MAKRKLSQNRKIYLDKGYLTHLTIKWKDVTKNEQARSTVMGMYEGKLDVPFTLMLIGHKQEVLKEVTQTSELEGCSAISRFKIKEILGDLKEEDVAEVTVKIEMNGQRLDVPHPNDWLRIATTCLERFHEACKQNDAEKHPSEKQSYFKWVSNNHTPSKIQNAEAVQDQFNFGSGAYGADPEVFEFEVNIDIRKQIKNSMNDVGLTKEEKEKGILGSMHKAYMEALNKKGEPIDFKWLKGDKDKAIPFGGDAIENIKTKAWPFGRTSAKLKHGKITVCDDGRYFVEGVLEFKPDYYSWEPDGKGLLHQTGIKILGNNWNPKGLDNWQHASHASKEALGEREPSIKDMKSKSHGYLGEEHGISNTPNAKRWSKPSKSYTDGTDPSAEAYGQMPINYTKDYYFYIFGIHKES